MSTDANRAKAARMRRAGTSLREIAKAFDVTAPTIKRWADEHESALAKGEPGAVEAEAAEAPEIDNVPGVADPEDIPTADIPDEMADALTNTRALYQRTRQLQERAQKDGNHKLAQMHGRDAAGLLLLLARLEKSHRQDSDTLHISRKEIATAFESVMDRAAAICSRPLLCAVCGRKLSAELAGKPEGLG